MRKIPNRLWDAVAEIAGMQHPSLAQILRRRGFGYEADRMDEFTAAFEQAKEQEKEIRLDRPPASDSADSVIEILLGTCELNLDEIEPETRDAIRRARAFLGAPKQKSEEKGE
jgi:hypothetical protein